jgi:hypothetical protein
LLHFSNSLSARKRYVWCGLREAACSMCISTRSVIAYGQMVKYAQHVSSEVVEIFGNLSAR